MKTNNAITYYTGIIAQRITKQNGAPGNKWSIVLFFVQFCFAASVASFSASVLPQENTMPQLCDWASCLICLLLLLWRFSLSPFHFRLQHNMGLEVSSFFRVVFICASLPSETSLFFWIISIIFLFEHSSWRSYLCVCVFSGDSCVCGFPSLAAVISRRRRLQRRCILNVKVIKRQNRKPPVSFFFFFNTTCCLFAFCSPNFRLSHRGVFSPVIRRWGGESAHKHVKCGPGSVKGKQAGEKVSRIKCWFLPHLAQITVVPACGGEAPLHTESLCMDFCWHTAALAPD